jgi:hypothetical protein
LPIFEVIKNTIERGQRIADVVTKRKKKKEKRASS